MSRASTVELVDVIVRLQWVADDVLVGVLVDLIFFEKRTTEAMRLMRLPIIFLLVCQ